MAKTIKDSQRQPKTAKARLVFPDMMGSSLWVWVDIDPWSYVGHASTVVVVARRHVSTYVSGVKKRKQQKD